MTVIPFSPPRLTLPMAPQAVARTRFSGGDKLPQAVPLQGIVTWLGDLAGQGKTIGGLEIDGPGDPLATPELTREILAALRHRYPKSPLSLATMGFGLAGEAERLGEAGLAAITLLVDTRDPGVAAHLYRWLRPGKRNVPLVQAMAVLAEEQTRGIAALRAAGIAVSLRTTVYSGINDREVESIARWAAQAGVTSMALQPGRGTDEEGTPIAQPPAEEMAAFGKKVATHLSLARQAGAAAKPGETMAVAAKTALPKPSLARPNVAVLSANGMDIDLHLGQAFRALIYGPREDGLVSLLDVRDLPDPGAGDNRWHELAAVVNDCFALLASHAGQRPREILAGLGMPVLLLTDGIEGAVDVLYGGGKKRT